MIGGEKFLCSSVRSGAEIDSNSMLGDHFFMIYISGITSTGKWFLKSLFGSYCAVFSLDLRHLGLKAYSHHAKSAMNYQISTLLNPLKDVQLAIQNINPYVSFDSRLRCTNSALLSTMQASNN